MSTDIHHTLEELLLIVALAIVAVITIFANLLVIAAFCIDKRLRKTNNYFVISLTIAGFLTGGYSIPLYCITKWTKTEPLPSICQLCGFLDNALATISVWTLAMTSLDRYYMVINYKRYKQVVTSGRAKLVLVLVWVYGGLVCAPPLLGWNEYHFTDSSTCGMKNFVGDTPDKEYFLFYFFTSFPFPLLIVTFSYTRIFVQAWGVYRRRERRLSAQQSRSIRNKKLSSSPPKKNGSFLVAHTTCNGSSVSSGNSPCSATHTTARSFSRQSSTVGGMTIDKTVRATLMVFVLVLTNITCTFPIFIFSLIVYWDNHVGADLPTLLLTFFVFLFFLNSALNPIMYGVFNTNFRGTFNRLLRCECYAALRQNTSRYTRLVSRLPRCNSNFTSTSHHRAETTDVFKNNNVAVQTPVQYEPNNLAGTKVAAKKVAASINHTASSADPLARPTPMIRIHIINSNTGSGSGSLSSNESPKPSHSVSFSNVSELKPTSKTE